MPIRSIVGTSLLVAVAAACGGRAATTPPQSQGPPPTPIQMYTVEPSSLAAASRLVHGGTANESRLVAGDLAALGGHPLITRVTLGPVPLGAGVAASPDSYWLRIAVRRVDPGVDLFTDWLARQLAASVHDDAVAHAVPAPIGFTLASNETRLSTAGGTVQSRTATAWNALLDPHLSALGATRSVSVTYFRFRTGTVPLVSITTHNAVAFLHANPGYLQALPLGRPVDQTDDGLFVRLTDGKGIAQESAYEGRLGGGDRWLRAGFVLPPGSDSLHGGPEVPPS